MQNPVVQKLILPEKQYPLRGTRKQRNRELLIETAGHLFACNGIAQTTLDEVADKAGFHVQTIFRHFPTKGDLVRAVDQQSLDEFAACFDRRETDALSCWRDWVVMIAQSLVSENGGCHVNIRQSQFLIGDSTKEYLEMAHEYERVLAAGIADDLGLDLEQDQLPVLFACMLWGANQFALRKWELTGKKHNLVSECRRLADDVINMIVKGKYFDNGSLN